VAGAPDQLFDLLVLQLDPEVLQHDLELVGVDPAVLVRVDQLEGRPQVCDNNILLQSRKLSCLHDLGGRVNCRF
jgi:hypothetical protein